MENDMAENENLGQTQDTGKGQDNAKGQDIAQMVENIMKNPEFTGIINELRGGDSGNTPQVSQGEILSHLPEVMSMLKPLIGDTGGSTPKENRESGKSESIPAASGAGKAVSAILPKKYDKSRAEKLMAALKPYLNSNRCEIIDKCVSVMQITDVVEALQGIEGITKPKP